MSKSVLCELDTLRNELKRVVSAIAVIQSAMESKVLADENDAPEALFMAWENLYDVSRRFSDVVDQEFAIRRGTV